MYNNNCQRLRLSKKYITVLNSGITLENHCTRTAQSLWGGCSQRGQKMYYFGLLWSILRAKSLQLLIFTMNFSFGIITWVLLSMLAQWSLYIKKLDKNQPISG